MGSKEPQKYILIEPTTLEDIQAWATDEVVERPLFKPFDENAIRKQIEDALEDYANFKLWESRQDWKDDFDRKDNLAHEKKMHVDKLLAILGGI